MRPPALLTTFLAAALTLSACGGSPGDPPNAGDQPSVELAGSLSEEDAREAGAAVTAFGFDLHGAVAEPGANVVTSPLSASVLLSMVTAGADGQAAQQLVDLLRLDGPRDVRPAALLAQLTGDDLDVDLSIANALWAAQGVPFEDAYVDHVGDTFGATLDELDLGSADAVDHIDRWVVDRTEGRIDGIASDLGLPDPQAVLVLVNAVHFLGSWSDTFDADDTRDAPFTLADGQVVDVPTMHHAGVEAEAAAGDGFEVLRLPYGDDGRFGMEILLPDEGVALDDLLAQLDGPTWQAAVDELTPRPDVPVTLPRFELEWDAQLQGPLRELGVTAAFDGGGFTPMSPVGPALSSVVQKTYIRVDEEGTEASAVTGGAMRTSAPVPFAVDRPFAFTVSDRDTGTVLFLGTVHDPRG